jgi:hypothetical protein
MLEVLNFPSMFVPLVREHYATLRELEEYYSFEDALNLLEIWAVNEVNADLQYEQMKRQQR